MNKKGIELSLNFLVILIISIVIFGFGITFLVKVFAGADNWKGAIDDRTEKEIEKILDDGSRVAIPFEHKSISNGKHGTFAIGILNTMSDQASDAFEVQVKFSKAYDKANSIICGNGAGNPPLDDCGGDPSFWLQSSQGKGDDTGVEITKNIRNNEQEKFLLGVSVEDAPAGTYSFDVTVCVKDRDAGFGTLTCPLDYYAYDKLHKIYVDVP